MVTALDSSILIAILDSQPDADRCALLLAECRLAGSVILCETAIAEVSAFFASMSELEAALRQFEVTFEPSSIASSYAAGQIHRQYRYKGGPREKMIADFMIGAHALHQADRLAASDRGYLREYFSALTVLQP